MRSYRLLVVMVAVWVVAAGCGGGTNGGDAGPATTDDAHVALEDSGQLAAQDGGGLPTSDGGQVVEPIAPASPTAPAPPMPPSSSHPPEMDCPEGWRAVPSSSGGATDPLTDYATCEPYASDDPETCSLGEAHFVGTAGCQPVGDPCPADEWPAGIDSLPSVLFVNDTAVGVGLGNTRIGAFRTIGQALSVARAGTTIAVAKGTYDEVLTIPDGVTVLGACAAETRIQPTTTGDRTAVADGVVRAAAASTGTIRNVSVIVPAVTLVGLSAIGDRNLVARGVAISEASEVALFAEGGATLTVERVSVADTRPGTDGANGIGALVIDATLRITRGMVQRSHDAGIALLGGTLALEEVAVLATEERLSDASVGVGLLVEGGANATVTRSLFDSNDTSGVAARDSGTVLSISDTVVRRTETQETAIDGFGLFVGPGAVVDAARCTFDRNRSVGVIAAGPGALLTLAHVAVTRTLPLAEGQYGRGLDVEAGAVADIDHAVFDGNRDHAVFVTDPGTSLVGSDLTLLRTAPGQASLDGVGSLHVRNGASVTLTAITVSDGEEGGVHVVGSGTVASIDDLVIRDTQAGEAVIGNAIDVDEGARLVLSRVALARTEHVALFASGSGTQVVASDLRVEETSPAVTGERGWGVRAQDGANVRIERAVIDGSTELAVFARDASTSLSLLDTAISRTGAAADGTGGFGLLAFEDATLSVERATVTDSHSVGVLAADSADVTLTDVRVSSTAPSPDGTGGWGASVQAGASMSATRVEIAGSTDIGLLVRDASLSAVDLHVSGVAERACGATCPASVTWDTGMGLVVDDGSLMATTARVESAARCGVLLSESPGAATPSPTLTGTAVYRSAIGLCHQLDAEPPALYLDAATNTVVFDRTTFEAPRAVSFL